MIDLETLKKRCEEAKARAKAQFGFECGYKTIYTLAVNWTYGIHDQLPLYWSEKSEEPTPEDWARDPSVCEKWQNTKQFHLDVCDQCRRYEGNSA